MGDIPWTDKLAKGLKSGLLVPEDFDSNTGFKLRLSVFQYPNMSNKDNEACACLWILKIFYRLKHVGISDTTKAQCKYCFNNIILRIHYCPMLFQLRFAVFRDQLEIVSSDWYRFASEYIRL